MSNRRKRSPKVSQRRQGSDLLWSWVLPKGEKQLSKRIGKVRQMSRMDWLWPQVLIVSYQWIHWKSNGFTNGLFPLKSCRKEQGIYDLCMNEKMGIKRPPLGYFTQLRVHETNRPKPKPTAPEFKDQTIGLPDEFPMEESKYGWRHYWFFWGTSQPLALLIDSIVFSYKIVFKK